MACAEKRHGHARGDFLCEFVFDNACMLVDEQV